MLELQVVPDCHPGAERPKKRTHVEVHTPEPSDFSMDFGNLLAKCDESLEADVS